MWKKEFDTSYVGFMKDGAQWLVDNTDIKLIGEFQVAVHHCILLQFIYRHIILCCSVSIFVKLMPMLIVGIWSEQ
jgi:hypothetical protein